MSSRAHTVESGAKRGQRTVIVVQRVGRLGNQIGLLANLIALSLATGVKVCHPTLGSYANYFKGTVGDLLCCYPPSSGRRSSPPSKLMRGALHKVCRLLDRSGLIRLVMPGRTFTSDYISLVDMAQPSFAAILRGGRYTFLTKGWFFRHPQVHKDRFLRALREFFALAEPYASNVEHLVKEARAGCEVLIGVHIRQTDFKEHAGGKYYFRTADYARLMRHCQQLFHPDKVGFFVVSDEPHDSSDFPLLRCSFGSGVDVEDMYCLGGCDYIIGSAASSFSLWPAVLFQKPTYRIFDPCHKPASADFKLTLEPWTEMVS